MMGEEDWEMTGCCLWYKDNLEDGKEHEEAIVTVIKKKNKNPMRSTFGLKGKSGWLMGWKASRQLSPEGIAGLCWCLLVHLPYQKIPADGLMTRKFQGYKKRL